MTMSATHASGPVVKICEDASELAAKAADLVVQAAREAVSRRGRFTIVLTGGSTPEKTYALLAQPERASAIDWANVFVFWGDERFVPVDDERSNLGTARTNLLDHVPIPSANVFPMPVQAHDAAAGAAEYARQLAEFFSVSEPRNPPRFDFIFLGLGSDGHVASLFSHAESLSVADAWVTWSKPGVLPPHVDRITLTYPVLNAGRQIVFLISGKEKAFAVHDVLEGRSPFRDRPAVGIRPSDGTLTWYVDKPAARLLKQRK
jgi:6-phosphogluconolactonase